MNDRFTDTAYYIYGSIVALLLLIGLVTQCIAFRIFASKNFRQKPLNTLFINIIIASLIFIVIEFPMTLTSLVKSSLVFGHVGCDIRGFLSGTAAIAMISTFYCITIKIMVLVHLKSRLNCLAKFHDSSLVVISWLFSSICMMPPLFGLNHITVEPGGLNCAPDWLADGFYDRLYVVILMVFVYILPVALLVYHFVCLWKDVYQLKQSHSLDYIKTKVRLRSVKLYPNESASQRKFTHARSYMYVKTGTLERLSRNIKWLMSWRAVLLFFAVQGIALTTIRWSLIPSYTISRLCYRYC